MTLTQIPKTDELHFKEKFVDRYSKLTDIDEFRRYSLSFLRKSIRINTLKISVPDLKARLEPDWVLTQVPWCKEGFWIDHKGEGEEKRRDIGNLLEHQLGYIYVQEAASMLPPLVLDPQPGEKVLDMCAAPGSKTTQIAQYMGNKGIIVANDILGTRLASLAVNVQRCGITNVMTTQIHNWRRIPDTFDRILVDAPCSGTGTIRKSLKTINMWNPNLGKRMASTQKSLISAGFDMLRPGGTMVYSTCTLEPHEDEGVINFLLDKHPEARLQDIKLDIRRSPAVTEFEGETYNDEVNRCLRIWPQDNDTEGFFVAKIRKE
ncbi:TPA: RsmB/NOP family class I SAM-dependent RNA methyltransferase [Candidatus Woesearchaeota archaeon]|nr:RsmB/NOP family class I SAM-dependent RNA methyltransferase [Candidatus Woesearchaeota archaeon]